MSLAEFLASALVAAWAVALPPERQEVTVTPRGLVQQTVENEVKSSDASTRFMFRSRKQTAGNSQTKLMVQTRDATAGMLIAINDKPLTPEQRQGEEGRLEYLVHNPAELKR
jgi:hypothetical protein